MVLSWDRSEPYLFADGRKIECWSKVRNELNGLRPRKGETDIVRAIAKSGGKGEPIMPRPFPAGVWKITSFVEHPDQERDGYLYPVYIGTNAYQTLDVWALDERGFYSHPTKEKVADYFYGLHFSTSDWTQGCIRIKRESDIRWLWGNVNIGDSFIVTG